MTSPKLAARITGLLYLPMPGELQSNIEYRYYPSGHMVYANEASLKALHDDVADFIRRTDGGR